jgi:hypothetical protein
MPSGQLRFPLLAPSPRGPRTSSKTVLAIATIAETQQQKQIQMLLCSRRLGFVLLARAGQDCVWKTFISASGTCSINHICSINDNYH